MSVGMISFQGAYSSNRAPEATEYYSVCVGLQ
jgi:hypothetical protein